MGVVPYATLIAEIADELTRSSWRFVQRSLTKLLEHLTDSSTPVSPQTQYQVALCFWLFTFEQNVCEKLASYVLSLSVDLRYQKLTLAPFWFAASLA